jgi:hypothetical protein
MYFRLWESKDIINYDNPWDYYEYLVTIPAGSDISYEEKDINGKKMLFVKQDAESSSKIYEVHFKLGENYYFILYGGKGVEDNEDIINRIIKSIEQMDGTDQYNGWNTYENEEYGFSFMYPSNWKLSGPEGEPYDHIAGTGHSGVGLGLSKDGLSISFTYNNYWDDISGAKCVEETKKLNLDGIEIIRLGYLDFDDENIVNTFWFYQMPRGEGFHNESGEFCTWEGSGILLSDDDRFTITFNSSSDMTYEEWEPYLDEMDSIVETLKLI